MLTIPWNSSTGWGNPKIQPYGPLALDPSSTVLHYAPTLFEGMKAYKSEDGVARLFRPDKVRSERRSNSRRTFRQLTLFPFTHAEHGAHDSFSRTTSVSREYCRWTSWSLLADASSTLPPRQDFTGEHLTTLIRKLVEIDSDWIPTDPGTSLCV